LSAFLQGIDHLQFEKDMFGNQDIVGMVSKEEELVNFSTTIHPQDAKGMVEKWLLQVHTYPLPLGQVITDRAMSIRPEVHW
jgi:dynein heavy chain